MKKVFKKKRQTKDVRRKTASKAGPTKDERRPAKRARRTTAPALPGKPVSTSAAEFTHLVLPPDTNALGTIFGGRIMEWVDIGAAIVASRHCRSIAVTASIDELHFLAPVRLGDIVILKTSVNYVSHTSMEIGVRVEAEDPRTGVRRKTSTAFLTFVALDENGRPTPVPPLILESQEDKRRFREGQKRHEGRKKRRPHGQTD